MTATIEASSGEGNRRAWSGWSNLPFLQLAGSSRVLGSLFGPCLVLMGAHVLFVHHRHHPHGGSIRPFEQTVQEGEAATSQDNHSKQSTHKMDVGTLGDRVQGTPAASR